MREREREREKERERGGGRKREREKKNLFDPGRSGCVNSRMTVGHILKATVSALQTP